MGKVIGAVNYFYKSEYYCVECGETLIDELTASGVDDTGKCDVFPDGETFPDSAEENEYCAKCGKLVLEADVV